MFINANLLTLSDFRHYSWRFMYVASFKLYIGSPADILLSIKPNGVLFTFARPQKWILKFLHTLSQRQVGFSIISRDKRLSSARTIMKLRYTRWFQEWTCLSVYVAISFCNIVVLLNELFCEFRMTLCCFLIVSFRVPWVVPVNVYPSGLFYTFFDVVDYIHRSR